ncbi:MAG: sugar ABC transporter substrate-binding protein [Candidatus Nanopelagicales bacterium]
MTKRRRIAVLGSLLAGALALSACGGGESKANADLPALDGRYELDPTTPAWKVDPTKDVELTWFVNADWWDDSWGKDVVTRQMEKDLNVKINFLRGDETRLNTMFASDTVADIVTIFGMNNQVALRANTWAFSLDDLSEAYDPYWNSVAVKDTLNWFRLPDGKTYGYPNYSNTAADFDSGLIPGNQAFLIRKDIYEALGKPSFATPAQFRAVMDKIGEKYPRLIPFGFNAMGSGTGSLGDVFQSFLGVPIEDADGGFYNRNLDEDYLTWLRTLRQVRSDGNISDDSFADDDTAFAEKVQTGRYATMLVGGVAQRTTPLQSWANNNPDSQYIAIDGPQSTVGNAPKLRQSGISGWMTNYISQNCSDPAKAMQIFTYLQSEYGQLLALFGIEGQTFTTQPDGKLILKPDVMKVRTENPSRFVREYRLGDFYFFGHDRYLARMSDEMRTPAIIQPQEWGRNKLFPQFILENIDPAPGTQAARNLSGINTNWSTTLVSAIRAGSDDRFDSVIAAHRTFLDNNGWADITKTFSENMDRNRKILLA